MVLCKSLIFAIFVFLIQVKNIHSLPEISENCQELSIRTEKYLNFFPLTDFRNDKIEDEIFWYKFYVKCDSDIHILFTETDSAIDGADCLEFVLNAPYTSASSLRVKIGGVESANTYEMVPMNITTPLPVIINAKKDGEVQMLVDNRTYPLLRYSGVVLNPKFISFSAPFAHLYYNCRNQQLQKMTTTERAIPNEQTLPVIYISLKIINLTITTYNSIEVNLAYTLIIVNPKNKLSIAGNNSEHNDATKYEIPKLKLFYSEQPVTNLLDTVNLDDDNPQYTVNLDDEKKLTASAHELAKIPCRVSGATTLFCILALGLEDDRFHLMYYPDGELFPQSLAGFGDVKLYQAPNLARASKNALEMDIEIKFKFDMDSF